MKKVMLILLFLFSTDISLNGNDYPTGDCDTTNSIDIEDITAVSPTKKLGVLYIQFADHATNIYAKGSVKNTTNGDSLYFYSDYYKQIFSVGTYKSVDPKSLNPYPHSPDERAIFGSFADYIDEVSYGYFSLAAGSKIINPYEVAGEDTLIEWLTAPQNKLYYMKKSYSTSLSYIYSSAVSQAISNGWMNSTSDYEKYVIVYAGGRTYPPYDDKDSTGFSGLKPCAWLNGTYCMTEERQNDHIEQSRCIAGIYTFTHEFFHTLGLPDIRGNGGGAYGKGDDGLGDFSLMATFYSTGFSNVMECPPHLSCYEKHKLGWLDFTEITGDEEDISIPNVEENNFAIKYIMDPSTEYVYIENRQAKGFDFTYQNMVTGEGGGLLIYKRHNFSRYLAGEKIMIIEADGTTDLSDSAYANCGDLGDFFPGTANVTSISDITIPNTNLKSGAPSGFAVKNISASQSTMSIDINIKHYISNITESITWFGDVYIDESITVATGKTLTINAGAMIKVKSGRTLTISGELNAEGTPSDPITFTSAESSPAPGDWVGIEFTSGASDNSVIENCIIEYAGTGIRVNNADIEINHNTIRNCSNTGIRCEYASPTISNNTLTNTGIYGIYLTHNLSPRVENNLISGNSYTGINLYYDDGATEITGNTISNSGTYGIRNRYSDAHYVNNRVNGHSYGIYCYGSPYADFRYNMIYGNTYGIYIGNGSPAFNSGTGPDDPGGANDIYSNSSYGLYIYGSATPNLGYYPFTRFNFLGGYNDIRDNNGSGAEINTNNTSAAINAYKNYWGTASPTPGTVWYGSGSVNYTDYLSEAWGGILPTGMLMTTTIETDEDLLFETAINNELSGNISEAESAYLSIIETYPESNHTFVALDRFVHSC